MTEGIHGEVAFPPVEKRVFDLLQECEAQKNGPTNGDVRIQAFAIAAEQSMLQNPNFSKAIEEVMESRPGYEAPYMFNLLLRAVQKQELKNRLALNYPNAYDSPDRWYDAIARAVDSESYEDGDFRYDILNRDIQTNKIQRYISAVIFRAIAADRLSEAPVVVDVGCSQNLGNKQQALKDFVYFDDVSVAPYDIQLPEGSRNWPQDKELTNRTNKLVWDRKKFEIKYGLGIDPWDIENEDNRLWVEACSFYPGEMIREDRHYSERKPGTPYLAGHQLVDFYSTQQFFTHQLLQGMTTENIGFLPVDFTKVDPHEVLDQLPGGQKPNLITIFTMLHQLKNDAERHKAMHNALKIVDEDGYILVKEFAEIDPSHKNRLIMNPVGPRQAGKFKLYMVDPRNPVEEYIHLATYDSGRCRGVQYQPAMGKLALSRQYGLVD